MPLKGWLLGCAAVVYPAAVHSTVLLGHPRLGLVMLAVSGLLMLYYRWVREEDHARSHYIWTGLLLLLLAAPLNPAA